MREQEGRRELGERGRGIIWALNNNEQPENDSFFPFQTYFHLSHLFQTESWP